MKRRRFLRLTAAYFGLNILKEAAPPPPLCLAQGKHLFKSAWIALALSCFQAYGTFVCSKEDAVGEAMQRWSGSVKGIMYDPDRDGYWIIMTHRGGRGEKIKYMPSDCEWYISPKEAERIRLDRQAEELERQAEEIEQLRPRAEELRRQAEELRQQIEQD